MHTLRFRHAVIAAALLLAVVAAWWAYKAHQQRQLAATVTALAREAGTRLREALVLDAQPQSEDGARKLEGHLAVVDGHLQKLRGLNTNTSSMLALGEAADDYVLTAREILRRLVVGQRARLEFAQSSRALLEHMRADHGGASWVGEAVRLKERVEKDFSDHKAATETLAKLLESFPAAQARIAPHIETPPLIDGKLLDAARQRALASARQAANEIEKIRKWVPRGPGRHTQD